MERTTSPSRRQRLLPVVIGAVLTMVAVLIPAAPAAAANGGVRIYNNCGSAASVMIYRSTSGVASVGGTIQPGNSYVWYLSTNTSWRFVMPRGTTYFTPTTSYTPTFAMC
jgi:hypothetical protein